MADLEQMKRWSMNVSWEEVFEYNMTSGTASSIRTARVTYGTEKQIQGFPEVWADSDMVHPGFKETFLQAFRVLRTGGDHARCEIRLKNRDGEYSWFAMELEVLSYEEGCPEIVLGTVWRTSPGSRNWENAYIRQARVISCFGRFPGSR